MKTTSALVLVSLVVTGFVVEPMVRTIGPAVIHIAAALQSVLN